MSTGIDIKYVKETYQNMPDEELIRVITQDAFGLTPEAMEVVKAEIASRGLDKNFAKAVDAQNKSYTIEDVDAYCHVIRELSCPTCGSTTERLNATMTGEVVSFIFFTQYSKRIKVGCPTCLDKANKKALTKTVLLGWWGLPWGIINSIQSIILNMNSKSSNHSFEHSPYLRTIAYNTIGELEAYKDNKEKLQQVLERHNNMLS